MTIIEGILLLLILCIGAFQVFLQRHMQRMSELLTERDMAYEAEKGKNYATKEDIEGITKQIEIVKNEISFTTQRKKDYIIERKQLLFDLLYFAEKISNSQNSLQLYARSTSEFNSLYKLVDGVNDTILEMTHSLHILIAEYDGFENEEVISSLVNNSSLLGAEIVTAAHNAAVAQRQSQNCFEDADKRPHLGMELMQQGIELNAKAVSYVSAPMPHKATVEDAITQYVIWLKKLFGQGLNFDYNLAKPII